MNKYIYYIVLSLFIGACSSEEPVKDEKKRVVKTKVEKVYTIDTIASLSEGGKALVEDLDYYSNLRNRIEDIQDATKAQILNQGDPISTLTLSLKDSTENALINSQPIQARLNALYTMSLRLKDMQDIPAITDQEAIEQGKEVVALYNGFIQTVNTVALKAQFEASLSGGNVDYNEILSSPKGAKNSLRPKKLPPKIKTKLPKMNSIERDESKIKKQFDQY